MLERCEEKELTWCIANAVIFSNSLLSHNVESNCSIDSSVLT
jgi:hypothetical protein